MNLRKFVWLMFVGLGAALISLAGFRVSYGDQSEQEKRGEYLVDLGSCNLCHTPKISTSSGMELDTTRLLSGHPDEGHVSEYTAEAVNSDGWVTQTNFHLTQWSGPWGVSFAANLTPDETTGIGSWTEDVFIETMRTGRHMGTGREIQMPMPWDNIGKLTDDDLKAIFAYLKSLKPVENRVPPPFPPEKTDKKSEE